MVSGARGAVLMAMSCAILFGPERIPLDEVGHHWEIRVRLCTKANEPHVIVESRSYLRVRAGDRYDVIYDNQDTAEGWGEIGDRRLYVTGEAPPQPPTAQERYP